MNFAKFLDMLGKCKVAVKYRRKDNSLSVKFKRGRQWYEITAPMMLMPDNLADEMFELFGVNAIDIPVPEYSIKHGMIQTNLKQPVMQPIEHEEATDE